MMTMNYLEVREMGHSRPEILGGSLENSEDPEQLVNLRVSLEEGPPVDHLCVDGSDGPDVDGTGILRGAEQKLRGPVPECHHLR